MDKDILRESFKLLDAITEQPSDLEAAFLIYDRLKSQEERIRSLVDALAGSVNAAAVLDRQIADMQDEIDDLLLQGVEVAPRDGVIYAAVQPTSRPVWLEATPPAPDFIVDRYGTVRTPEAQDAADYELYLKRAALGLA